MLGLLNVEQILIDELIKHTPTKILIDKLDNVDTLMIDWLPTAKKSVRKAPLLLNQTNIIEESIKRKIPVILFDRYLSITEKEYHWLRKFGGIRFCEPALNYRRYFSYLPFPIKCKNRDTIELNETSRELPLVYKGDLENKIKSFEKYYLEYGKMNPDQSWYDGRVMKGKELEYTHFNVNKKEFELNQAKCMLLLGSQRDYTVGYLDGFLSKLLNNNVIPLLPAEHKYYSFTTTVADVDLIEWFVNSYDMCYIGFLLDVYNRIDKCYNEMTVGSVSNQIMEWIS